MLSRGLFHLMIAPLEFVSNLDLSAWLCLFSILFMNFVNFIFSSDYTSGYFTTIAAIILFSSVQLIFIGVLGEYIGKIYYEVKQRPHFIVAKSNIDQAEKDKIG